MAFIEDVFKSDLGTGLAVGIGVLVLGPIVVPAVAGVAKPLLKAAIKGGLIIYDQGKSIASSVKKESGCLLDHGKNVVANVKKESEQLYDKGKGLLNDAKDSFDKLVEESRAELSGEVAVEQPEIVAPVEVV